MRGTRVQMLADSHVSTTMIISNEASIYHSFDRNHPRCWILVIAYIATRGLVHEKLLNLVPGKHRNGIADSQRVAY